MQAIRKKQRFLEQWEYRQERQFVELVQTSQELAKKQINVVGTFFSILLFVAYKAVKMLWEFSRAITVKQCGISQRRLEAEQFRARLSGLPEVK